VARRGKARNDDLREQSQGERDGRNVVGPHKATADGLVPCSVASRDIEAGDIGDAVPTPGGTYALGNSMDDAAQVTSGLFAPDRNKLTSDCTDQLHTDHWIEVDEVLVGGKEEGVEHRGGGAETKTLVAVAVEVHSWYGVPADCDTKDTKRRARAAGHTRAGRCRMHVIADTKAETLTEFIRRNVVPGSSIWTDASRSYNQSAREGYSRRTTIAKDDPDPLPTLGRVTTNLKRWLVGTHKGAVQPQHLQAYLNEFVFRFNRRDIPWVAFNRALGLAALNRPAVQYEGLYKHTWVHPTPELS